MRLSLFREVKYDFGEAVGHQGLGRPLALEGAFPGSVEELDAAINIFAEQSNAQWQGLMWADRARRFSLMWQPGPALKAARQARQKADETARTHFPH